MLLPVEGGSEIAVVADDPGGWIRQGRILEHQKSGMMGCVKVV